MADVVNEKPVEKVAAPENEKASSDEKKPKKQHDRPYLPHAEYRRMHEEEQANKEVVAKGQKGTVKWYSVRSKYGFIARDDDKENDVFVHQTAIFKSRTRKQYFRTLAADEPVEFDIVKGKKGLEAANVTGPEGAFVSGSPLIFRLYNRGGRFSSRSKAEGEDTRGPRKERRGSSAKEDKEDEEKKPKRSTHRNRRPRSVSTKSAAENPDEVNASGDAKPKSEDEGKKDKRRYGGGRRRRPSSESDEKPKSEDVKEGEAEKPKDKKPDPKEKKVAELSAKLEALST